MTALGDGQHDEQQEQASRPHADLPAERLAYSVDEVAQLTGLSRDLLYDQMRAGKLDYLKVGRRQLVTYSPHPPCRFRARLGPVQ
jgi:excisionase family DNA binding protein